MNDLMTAIRPNLRPNRHAGRRHGRTRGFSLVELLVAIAVGLMEALEYDYQVYRQATVKYMSKSLEKMGVPIVRPPGGHAQAGEHQAARPRRAQEGGWSERRDLNSGPLAPHASALPGCATLRPGEDLANGWGRPARAQ